MRRLHTIPQERQIVDYKIFGISGATYITPTIQYGNIVFNTVDWSPALGDEVYWDGRRVGVVNSYTVNWNGTTDLEWTEY